MVYKEETLVKKKGIRLIAILIVLVALVAGYFVLSKKNDHEAKEDETSATDGILLHQMDLEDIANISFTYEGKNYGFSRTDGVWYYDGDKNFPVNQNKMDVKSVTILELFVDRELKGDLNPADFGLDNPVTSVTVTNVKGEKQTFSMGDRNPTASSYYMKDENTGKMYLMDGSLIVAFADGFTLYDVADLERFPTFSAEDVFSVVIDGTNRIEGEIFGSVAKLDFEESVDYDATEEEKETYGLTNPVHKITFTYAVKVGGKESSMTKTLFIGAAKDETQTYVMFQDSKEVSTILTENLTFLNN